MTFVSRLWMTIPRSSRMPIVIAKRSSNITTRSTSTSNSRIGSSSSRSSKSPSPIIAGTAANTMCTFYSSFSWWKAAAATTAAATICWNARHYYNNYSEDNDVDEPLSLSTSGSSSETSCETVQVPPHSTTNQSDQSEKPQSILFVWDFDWTVINCNSDEYIPAQFISDDDELRNGFRKLYKDTNGDWHKCVEGMVAQTNASPTQLLQAAEQMPYLQGVQQTIQDIYIMNSKQPKQQSNKNNNNNKSNTTRQMILSDGNTIFIQAFLQAQNLQECFVKVVSNHGSFNKDTGRLQVVHQSEEYGGHDCDRCSANLCKTQALTETLKVLVKEQKNRPTRIVYVGDGGNDACPVLNVLQEDDILLARAGTRRPCANQRRGIETDEDAICCGDNGESGATFGILPTLKRAKEEQDRIPKCQVWEWRTGDELRMLVQRILAERDNNNINTAARERKT